MDAGARNGEDILQWDALGLSDDDGSSTMMCLPCAAATSARTSDEGKSASTDVPQTNHSRRSKAGGHEISFNAVADVTPFCVDEGDRIKLQFNMDSITDMVHTQTPVKKKAPEYQHSDRIKKMNDNSQSRRREARRAILKARLLSKEVELDLDRLPELDEPELGHRRGILKNFKCLRPKHRLTSAPRWGLVTPRGRAPCAVSQRPYSCS